MTTKDLIDQVTHKPPFSIENLTGIRTRRRKAHDEDSLTIALAAARECLKNSAYGPEDLDIIIYTGITRFVNGLRLYFEPAMSLMIKKELGAVKAMNMDITNACAGMVTGGYILDNLIKAGAVACGMVVSGEAITTIADRAMKEITKPVDPQLASLTVGDAGAAYILDESPNGREGIDFINAMAISEFAELCIGLPSDQDAGPVMLTESTNLQFEAIKRLCPSIADTFHEHNQNREWDRSIAVVIAHQTSVKAIGQGHKSLCDFFNVDSDLFEVPVIVDRFGNTASTSHFVVLHRLLQEGKIKPWQKVLILAQASGIILGSFCFTIGKLEV